MISSVIVKPSHKLLGRTDFRTDIAVYGADGPYDGFGFGIIEMPIVPRQKIVDTVHSGYGNVKGVVQGLGR